MLALKKAIEEIRWQIPPDILREVFMSKIQSWRSNASSLDEQILVNVIRPRVLMDANIVGGTEINVSMEGLKAEIIDNYMAVYNIPKSRTQGRSIMSVSSISYASMSATSLIAASQAFSVCSQTPVLAAGQALFDSVNTIPNISSARVSLIGENVILVQDTAVPMAYGFITCTIANDENLSNIQIRSIIDFADMCVLAVKAYIYNEYRIKLDQGYISGGQEIGAFKEIIEEYRDANQMYREFLKQKWQKIAYMNDRVKMTRHIRRQAGSWR